MSHVGFSLVVKLDCLSLLTRGDRSIVYVSSLVAQLDCLRFTSLRILFNHLGPSYVEKLNRLDLIVREDNERNMPLCLLLKKLLWCRVVVHVKKYVML